VTPGGRERRGDGPGWEKPSSLPSLHRNEIHVWRAWLDLPDRELTRLTQLLPPEEVRRAARFSHDIHRRRFIAHKGTLRGLVASYLGLDPCEVHFEIDRWGKPRVVNGKRTASILFNTSHSADLALYSFSCRAELGIDVERIDCGLDWAELAGTALSESEVLELRSMPRSCRLEAFFATWTRKEALAKAVGLGLWLPLSMLRVPIDPWVTGWRIHQVPTEMGKVDCRQLDLTPGAGYRASLAVLGMAGDVCWFDAAAREPMCG